MYVLTYVVLQHKTIRPKMSYTYIRRNGFKPGLDVIVYVLYLIEALISSYLGKIIVIFCNKITKHISLNLNAS